MWKPSFLCLLEAVVKVWDPMTYDKSQLVSTRQHNNKIRSIESKTKKKKISEAKS